MKIGIIGAGRLGLCLALNLERSGFEVHAVDVSQERVEEIQSRKITSVEPLVEEYLSSSNKLFASTDVKTLLENEVELIFVCVQTPSLPDGSYDHSYIESSVEQLIANGKPEKKVDFVINATTMPGYCDELNARLEPFNYKVSYNPEFIAQGSIIRDQQYPDQVLIGEADTASGDKIALVYEKMCENTPVMNRMGRTSAEITKLGVNCFLTTKIAFANSIGDLCQKVGADYEEVLSSIGSDSRVGNKFLKYGFGFGGPCLPRDNRALAMAAKKVDLKLDVSEATDKANQRHLNVQLEQFLEYPEPITFDYVTYKEGTDILEESQRLLLAIKLMEAGKKVKICGQTIVIEELKARYGDQFIYEEVLNE